MKVWGLAATLAFAVLAFVLGQALGIAALTAIKPFDPLRVDSDGTALAIVTLIANPVQTVTLILAARWPVPWAQRGKYSKRVYEFPPCTCFDAAN